MVGSLLGFAGSAIPTVTDFFGKKQDNSHEIEKLRLAAELKKDGYEFELDFYNTVGMDKEHERLISHDTAINQGVGFAAGLAKSVRPVITYLFFFLFLFVESVLIYNAFNSGADLGTIRDVIWTEETEAIWAAIVSFWFGTRALDKAREHKINKQTVMTKAEK